LGPYRRIWKRRRLNGSDFVLSADEKNQYQASQIEISCSITVHDQAMRVEHDYERCVARAQLEARDVRRAKLFDRCEAQTGFEPTDSLVAHMMSPEPYKSARRVFSIRDKGSGHRGDKPA